MDVIILSLLAISFKILYNRRSVVQYNLENAYLDFLKISQGEACMSVDVFYIL